MTSPKGMDLRHHRTIEYSAPMSMATAKATIADFNQSWNGRRYDLLSNNCNSYVNDALKRLGCGGLDREYLDASGIAKSLRHVPGTSTAQELLLKWPLRTKEIPKALEADAKKIAHIPRDAGRELRRGAKKAEKATRRIGRSIGKRMGW